MVERFYSTLFDEDDALVIGNEFANRPVTLSASLLDTKANFFTLNPISLTMDNETSNKNYTPGVGRRADANVTKHRNLLFEIDRDLSVAAQLELYEKMRLPWSTQVYSGSKSVHSILSLVEPVDPETYLQLFLSFESVFAAKGIEIDSSCKNPSKLSRRPCVLREGTDVTQELIGVRERLPLADVFAWLGKHKAAPKRPPVRKLISEADRQEGSRMLSVHSLHFINTGIVRPGASRHNKILGLAFDCAENGWDRDSALDVCLKAASACGLLEDRGENEVITAVDYAYAKIGHVNS